mmetsp:Transcript_24101/g.77723  ORF Transcript_24101/g.77723 Transcript_24101/m.77723 type:complete len:259 (-) Transcript_24101:486-1262(-)
MYSGVAPLSRRPLFTTSPSSSRRVSDASTSLDTVRFHLWLFASRSSGSRSPDGPRGTPGVINVASTDCRAASISTLAHSAWPFWQATSSAVAPFSFVPFPTSAPASTSNLTQAACPISLLTHSGVAPVSVRSRSTAAPYFTNVRAQSAWPFKQAVSNGVDPFIFCARVVRLSLTAERGPTAMFTSAPFSRRHSRASNDPNRAASNSPVSVRSFRGSSAFRALTLFNFAASTTRPSSASSLMLPITSCVIRRWFEQKRT